MPAKKAKRASPKKKNGASRGTPAKGAASSRTSKALPKPTGPGGAGRVDVTGIMPDDIRIDPDITEGHLGYDESGESEINLRRSAGSTTE